MSVADFYQVLIHAILAIFGVTARELRYKDERQIKVARLISNAIVASFGATIVYFVSFLSGIPPQLGYIMAGLVGWGGPQVIDKLFEKNVNLASGMDLAKMEDPKPVETRGEAGDETQI